MDATSERMQQGRLAHVKWKIPDDKEILTSEI
jgi:hypothetical protein